MVIQTSLMQQKIWDINVENPTKMKAAFDELTHPKNQDILGGRYSWISPI